jgi:hypothetical protein
LAFLWHIFCEPRLLEDFVKTLPETTCKALLVAEMYKCKWNEGTRTLTMGKDKAREEKAKVFKSTP